MPRAMTLPWSMIASSVAQALGFVHVVRRQQDRPARLLELLDEVPQLPPRLRVEPGGRLVEEQQIGIADERARERQALFLSARQRDDARVALLLELHQRDDLVRRRAPLEEAAEQAQRLADRQLVGELRLLQLDAQPLAQRLRIGRPAEPEHLDVARVGLRQPFADLDRRGLAGAVRTEQAEALARRARSRSMPSTATTSL